MSEPNHNMFEPTGHAGNQTEGPLSRPATSSGGIASSSPADTRSLDSGHRVDVNPNESVVRISNAEGRIELTVRCTAEGCMLEFATGDLALSAAGRVSLQCEELVVDTRRRLELNTEGDWASHVAGHSTTRVGGRSETHADEVELRANRGDALVHANDHVRLVGEQILLNSEHEGLASSDQLEAFWRSFGL